MGASTTTRVQHASLTGDYFVTYHLDAVTDSSYFVYRLIPTRPTFDVDMSDDERAIIVVQKQGQATTQGTATS